MQVFGPIFIYVSQRSLIRGLVYWLTQKPKFPSIPSPARNPNTFSRYPMETTMAFKPAPSEEISSNG